MVRIRSGFAVIVALGLVGACSKKSDDKKTDQPATADKTTDQAKPTDNAPPADQPAAPVPGPIGDDLGMIPADSEMVIGVNFTSLSQSALWKQNAPAIINKMTPAMAEIQQACGIDPMTTFKSAVAGMKGQISAGTASGFAVLHGLAKAKVTAKDCIDKWKAALAKNGGDVALDGDALKLTSKGGQTAWLGFVNDDTAAVAFGSGMTKDSVTKGPSGKTLRTSARFVDLFNKLNNQDSVWILLNGNYAGVKKLGQMIGANPIAVYGSVNVTDGVNLDLRFRFGSADEATAFLNMAKGQINNPQVKGMLDKLDATADGQDVKFAVGVGPVKLQAIAGLLSGAFSQIAASMSSGGGGGAAPPPPPTQAPAPPAPPAKP